MADYITSLFGGQMYDPQQAALQQQQAFQQSLSQAVTPQQFIATVGSNLGGQLGQSVTRMFGGQTNQEKVAAIMKQVSQYPDPMTRAYEAERLLNAAGLTQQAEIMRSRIEDLRKADLAEQQQQLAMEASRQTIATSKAEQQRKQASDERAIKLQESMKGALLLRNPNIDEETATAIAGNAELFKSVMNPKLDTSNMGEALRAASYKLYGKNFSDITDEEQKKRIAKEAMDFLSLKSTKAGAGGAGGAPKPITGTILKNYTTAQRNYTTAGQTAEGASKFINLLDDKKMLFGAAENVMTFGRGVVGKSNESDVYKSDLRRFTTSAVNSILNMAKGPQTDQDATRARDQIMNGLDNNDAALVRAGLVSLQKTMEESQMADEETLQTYEEADPRLKGHERRGKKAPASSEAAAPTATPAPKSAPIKPTGNPLIDKYLLPKQP